MRRAGWTRAEELTLRNSWGIVVSAVFHRSDSAAPVSPLFLFGRCEAFAYEPQVGGSASHRHHVRFWPTPADWVLPGGRRLDWLAAGTFDRAVGLSLFTLQVTHKVDADIDAERDHVVQTVTQHVAQARSEVLEDFVSAFHSRIGGGDVVRTDGDLVVLDLTAVPVPPDTDRPPVPASSWWASRLPAPALLIAGVLGLAKAAGGVLTGGVTPPVSAAVILLWVGLGADVADGRLHRGRGGPARGVQRDRGASEPGPAGLCRGLGADPGRRQLRRGTPLGGPHGRVRRQSLRTRNIRFWRE